MVSKKEDKSHISQCNAFCTKLARTRDPFISNERAIAERADERPCFIIDDVMHLKIRRLRTTDYGLRTTAGRALSFFRSTRLSRVNIER